MEMELRYGGKITLPLRGPKVWPAQKGGCVHACSSSSRRKLAGWTSRVVRWLLVPQTRALSVNLKDAVGSLMGEGLLPRGRGYERGKGLLMGESKYTRLLLLVLNKSLKQTKWIHLLVFRGNGMEEMEDNLTSADALSYTTIKIPR